MHSEKHGTINNNFVSFLINLADLGKTTLQHNCSHALTCCLIVLGRWVGVTWAAMAIRLVKHHIWIRWQRKECFSATFTLQVPYAHHVGSV